MSSPVVAAPPRQSDAVVSAVGRRPSLAWLAAIPIAFHAVLAWIVRLPTIATGNDDAVYLLLARALREGHYRELFYIGTPVHSQYPPGYPVVLALLGAPADGDIALIVAVNILFSCAALALAFDVMRRWSLPLGLAGVAVLALNPSLIEAASRVQSEPMFMAALILALWALRPSAPVRHRWIAIAAVIIATLTRSAGIAIIAGLVVHFVTIRAWRHAVGLTIAAALTVGPWLAWTAMAPQKMVGRSYIADVFVGVPLADSPSAAPVNARSEARGAGRAVAVVRSFAVRARNKVPTYVSRSLPGQLAVPTVEGTPVDNAGWLVIMLATGFVGAVAAWSRWRAALWALLAYSGLLVIWPWAVGRFLTPLLPALVGLLLLGAWRIGLRLWPRYALVPMLTVAAILVAGGSQGAGAMVAARAACPESDRSPDGSCVEDPLRYRRTAESLAARLPSDARVFTTKEGTFHYWTGISVVPLYPTVRVSTGDLRQYLADERVTVIFLPHLKPEEGRFGERLTELCAELTDGGSPTDEVLVLWNRLPGPGEANGCVAVARWRATW